MRTKNHNFSLHYAPRDKHKSSNADVTIYLKYSYGFTRRNVSTKVKVPKGSWNAKNRSINLIQYPYLVEAQKRLDEIMSRTYEIAQKLSKQKISLETALDEILERMPDESVLDYYTEWFKKKKGVGYATFENRRDMLVGIQNKMVEMGKKEYAVLKFEHFADINSLETIAYIIKNDFGLKPNGAYIYLKRLDEIYNKKYRGQSPFLNADLRGSYESPDKEGVPFRDMLAGIGRIKTLQDFEAYLFFLYSFCLRGLTGKDIFNIREEDFVGVDDQPYIPNSVNYYEKQHYLKVRGKRKNKTSKKMKILSNLYPTNHIYSLLKWCIQQNRPEICARENDGALFKKCKDEKEVARLWGGLRTTYYEALTNLIGKGVHSARHTYSDRAIDLGISESKVQASLGQVPKELKGESILNYMKDKEEELDLLHIDILDEAEIVLIYFELIEFLKDRRPFRCHRNTFFPKWFKKEHNQFAYMRGEKLTLQGWTYKDEFRLSRLEEKQGDLQYIANVRAGYQKPPKPMEGGGLFYEGTIGGKQAPIPVNPELIELRKKKESLVQSLG